MELTSSPMTDRQRKYRATYRDRIAGWYNGWLHAFVIYVIGFTALSVYIANIGNVRWWEWLIVPITFLAANFSNGGFTVSSCTVRRRSRPSARSTTGTP